MAKRSAVYTILISLFIFILSINSVLSGQSNLSKAIKNQTGSGDKIRVTFSYSPLVPVTGVPIRFICKTNYTPDTWLWEFGDGTISYEPSPAHDYANPVSYTHL
ncbi:MAG: PKD domain-containing protein, partial [Candidatus Aminicenantes bacterium]|nr:PKD domain-containing protein [Candidatus Aminicenantes bacterium]